MAGFESALVRKLTRYLKLGQDELALLDRLEAQRRPVPAGTELRTRRHSWSRGSSPAWAVASTARA
jgi:hypothetical protein